MTPITVPDMSGVQAASTGGRLPRGWNRLRIEVADDSEKSKNGHDQIAFEFSARHGSIRHWMVFSDNPKAFPFIKRDLEAMGIDLSSGATEINAKALVGRQVDALIEHEPGVNKANEPVMYARIKGFRRADGPDPTPDLDVMPEAPAAGFAGGNGTVAPSPAQSAEDDIPF